MSEIQRKQRHTGRLKRLLDVAIEQKDVLAGFRLGKLIAELEGWLVQRTDEEPQERTERAPDMSRLLEHIEEKKEATN